MELRLALHSDEHNVEASELATACGTSIRTEVNRDVGYCRVSVNLRGDYDTTMRVCNSELRYIKTDYIRVDLKLLSINAVGNKSKDALFKLSITAFFSELLNDSDDTESISSITSYVQSFAENICYKCFLESIRNRIT